MPPLGERGGAYIWFVTVIVLIMAVWQCECGHKAAGQKGLAVHESKCATSLMYLNQRISAAQNELRRQDGPSKRRCVRSEPHSPPKSKEPSDPVTGSHSGMLIADPRPAEVCY
jgi:hypothetical protein